MATARATIEIPASADKVWQLMGGFGSLPEWAPVIVTSVLREGGRVRRLETADGAEVVERLLSFDEQARRYSYSILESPFPIAEYRATLAVREGERPGTTLVEWSGEFTPKGVSEAEVVAIFTGVYEGGLAALRANF